MLNIEINNHRSNLNAPTNEQSSIDNSHAHINIHTKINSQALINCQDTLSHAYIKIHIQINSVDNA